VREEEVKEERLNWSEVNIGEDCKAVEVGDHWLLEGATRGAERLVILVAPLTSALPSLHFRAKFHNVLLPYQQSSIKLPPSKYLL
jgi:hypothetical protein